MKNSFWELIWSSFLEIQGFIVGFLGVMVSLLAWVLSSKTQISLALVITIAVFTLIIVITLFQAAYKAFRQTKKLESEIEKLKQDNQKLEFAINQRIIPTILITRKDPKTQLLICLLEFSETFGINLSVSFYYTDEDGFEIFIGEGFIKNIQRDGKVQAILDKPQTDYQEVIDKLANNEQKILDKTVVKPGVTRT